MRDPTEDRPPDERCPRRGQDLPDLLATLLVHGPARRVVSTRLEQRIEPLEAREP
jgi:hypothetical protein